MFGCAKLYYLMPCGSALVASLRHRGREEPCRGADTPDLFGRSQLNAVIASCRESSCLSEAGRKQFAVSRQEKKQPDDADRLRKYLARFGLDFETVSRG